jgi:hypothetical protein
MASDNREQILKDVESLSLEKYIDEVAGAVVEGLARCKTEKDVWSAVEVLTDFHDPSSFGLLKNLDYFSFALPFSEFIHCHAGGKFIFSS